MSEEPRRSGRATKGQHTKNQDAEEAPKSKRGGGKRGSKKSVEPVEDDNEQNEEEEEDDNSFIRCVCGDTDEDGNGKDFIQCERCNAWQHIPCMGLDPKVNWNKRDYFCEQCQPDQHKELLEAIARGEKPWERKGKKGKRGRAPKGGKQSRPSEAVSELDEEVRSQKPAVSSPAVVDEAPQASAVASTAAEANGNQQTTKGQRKASSHHQPHSPAGEKRRRDTNQDVDPREPKRRKSGVQGPTRSSQPPPSEPPTTPGELPSDRKAIVDAFRKVVEPLIRAAAKDGSYRIPDGETPSSLSESLGLRIDTALVQHHGASTVKEDPYFQKFLSIRFNVKKNNVLLQRLLLGTLTADELAVMSSEDMASEEKQREYANIREENDKQVVLIQEEGPRIRKTHKGEELIGEETNQATDGAFFAGGAVRHRNEGRDKKEDDDVPDSPMHVDSPVTVELPEDIGPKRPLTVDTSATPASQGPASGRHPSTAGFDIQQVWSSVHSPDNDQHRQSIQALRRQSSIATQQQGPGDDADIDRLLKDEDGDGGDYSPAEYINDPTIAWRGQVDMPSIGQFEAAGRFVAGGNVALKVPWPELVPKLAVISGRIDIVRANQYVEDMRGSMTSDVSVLSLTPINATSRTGWSRVFAYFHSRQRWGVISNYTHPCMRDIYIIPIESGSHPLPSFLEMLEDSVIETPRPEPLLLLAIVARTKELQAPAAPAASIQQTPTPNVGGYPALPNTPHPQPLFSPVVGHSKNNHAFAVPGGQAPNYPSPYPQASPVPPPSSASPLAGISHPVFGQLPTRASPLAIQILGPHIGSPVVQQILESTDNPTETILRNLKDILDRVPEARMDMNVLRIELGKGFSNPV